MNISYLGAHMTPRFLIYLCLLLTLVIYSVYNYKKTSSPFKLLTLLIMFTLISESMTLNGLFPIKNTLILYHVLLPLTMFMLWLIFNKLPNNKRNIDFIIMIIFVLSAIGNSIWQQTALFPSNGLALLCVLGVWLSLQTFKKMLLLPIQVKITKQAVFWLSASTLFFYSITFFTFAFFHYHYGVEWLQRLNAYSVFILYMGYGLALYFDINRNKFDYVS
jgi:hypothetical protein